MVFSFTHQKIKMADTDKDSDFDSLYKNNAPVDQLQTESIGTPDDLDYSQMLDESGSVGISTPVPVPVPVVQPRAALPGPPLAQNERGSGLVFDASIEIFKRHGFAIQQTDEIYVVMQFLQESMHSMHAKERVDWRVMVDTAMAGMHDIREEMKTTVAKQREEIGMLKEEIESMRQRSIESINETMRQAQLGADEYSQKITAAAETQFKVSLRQLINEEMRAAIALSAQIEIDMLKKALNDATAQAKEISTGLGGTGPNVAALGANLTQKFKALAPWQQGAAAAVAVLVLAYIFKSI